MSDARLVSDGEGGYRVEGALTFDTVVALWDAGGPAPGAGPRRIDLASVRAVDSAGLALLVDWARGRQVEYTHPPAALVSLARVGGLAGLFGLE